MKPPESQPRILVSAPERLQGRLQSIVAGRARTIPVPGAAALRNIDLTSILHDIDGLILAEECIGPDCRALARRIERAGLPYLLATASNRQAHLIFELSARDYVLLTHPEAQITATIARFLASLTPVAANRRPASDNDARPAGEPALWVRSGHAERRVLCHEIKSISADRDYAVIEVGSASLLVRSTMAALEAELDPERFLRIHRSHIIAVDRIEEVRTLGPNRHEVRLDCGRSFPVGRTFWPGLKQQLRSYKLSGTQAAS